MIVNLIRTMDRVILKGRSRAVRTDPYTRLLLIYLSLILLLCSLVPVPGTQSSIAVRLKQNFNVLNASFLVDSWL